VNPAGAPLASGTIGSGFEGAHPASTNAEMATVATNFGSFPKINFFS
jgi:hypothetical protein